MTSDTQCSESTDDLDGTLVDGVGVAVIVVGAIAAAVAAARAGVAHQPGIYPMFRRHLGRSILLGLELLVAADIIRTVAVTPTLASVAVLALIVLIRTFLSFSLELEITGRCGRSARPNRPPREATSSGPVRRDRAAGRTSPRRRTARNVRICRGSIAGLCRTSASASVAGCAVRLHGR